MRSLDRVPPRGTATPPAVILAAGEGSRLRDARSDVPKPLVRLRGLSLAERSIAQLATAGVERFVVVLGCDAALVQHEFERVARRRRCHISFVEAENWENGNGCSAAAAAPLVGDSPFLLTMVDHLLPPEMIRKMLADPPAQDEVALGVDYDTENVFDLPDLTKVQVSGGRIAAVGKDLATWNAGDTGLFYCSPRLFDGLAGAHEQGNFSLTDGIRECIAQGWVRPIDVTGERWLDVDTPEAFQEAVHRIDAALAKGGEDGFISRHMNRPLSRRLSVALSRTPLTPNHITLLSFFIALLGAVGLATTDPWFWIAGGILIQIASIVDGCDGEIARIKLLQSPQGAWLDTVLDRYSDMAIGLAVTFAASQLHDAAWVWPAGFAATASFLMASYVTKEFQIRFQRPYPNDLVNKLKRRDLRILAIAVGAALGHPLVALLAIGSLTHLAVFQILVSGRHTTLALHPSHAPIALTSRGRSPERVPLGISVGATAGQTSGGAAVGSLTIRLLPVQTAEPGGAGVESPPRPPGSTLR
jgi:1L-myo-inositol 1-phosphate cytidylyltransferase / CDP-L-myo-inositol myo-inositolphosphotransferase